MSRKGPRPHTWRYQDPVVHVKHIAWMRMKAQADFRGEPWSLSFEEYQELWGEHWHRKGRGSDEYCMTRQDPDAAWDKDNAVVLRRADSLRLAQTRKRS
jgi:hypothetical protein